MYGIVLFIFLAIGAALGGDFSGLEMIGKILLVGAIFLFVAWLITSKIYILLLIIGGIILIANLCKL